MSETAKPHHPNPQAKGEKSHVGDFSYVGIDAILEQMRRKAMKQGFELNLMVVGELWTWNHLIKKLWHHPPSLVIGTTMLKAKYAKFTFLVVKFIV